MSLAHRFFMACGIALFLILWSMCSEQYPGMLEKGTYIVICLLAFGFIWKSSLPFFIRRPTIVVGGIYSSILGTDKQGALSYGITKVLRHENNIVHLRVYKNLFIQRPQTVDLSSLSIGQMGIDEFPGMGHMPFSESAFAKQQPVLLTTVGVEADELDGYQEWKKQGGGVFS